MKYIIECKNGGNPWWIAPWTGDPGRTVVIENARIFSSKEEAEKHIVRIDKKYQWRELKNRLEIIELTK